MERKHLKKLLFLGLCVLFLLGIVLKEYNIELMEVFGESNQSLVEVAEQISYNNKSKYIFGKIEKDLLVGNKDGLKRLRSDGREVWNLPYSLSNPILSVEGEYAVVADVGGKDIQVFNNRGLVYNNVTNYPILGITSNENGNVVVIEESKDAQIVTVFNAKGEAKFKVNIVPERDGYPIDIAINEDGDKLAISYLDASDIEISSKMVFYQIGTIDITKIDQIVGSIHNEGVIGKVFAIGDVFVGIATDKVIGVNFASNIEEQFSIDLTNKVIGVAHNNKRGQFALAFGDPLPGNKENNEKQVLVYDYIGNNIQTYQSEYIMSYLHMTPKTLIIGGGHEFVALEKSGNVKWRYTATIDIRQVEELSDDQIFLIGENYYQLYKKTKLEKKDTESTGDIDRRK